MTREDTIWLEDQDPLPDVKGVIYVNKAKEIRYVVTIQFEDWRDSVRIGSTDSRLFLRFGLNLDDVERFEL